MTGQAKGKGQTVADHLQSAGVEMPLVTVVVTNYNYERFILACLESIARQSYENFKCVIVDDASSDDSVAVIEKFISPKSTGSRFELVRHEENKGQMAGFMTGLSHAEGPFLVYVDADDMLKDDFVEAHVRAHTQFEPVAFTSSNQYQINENAELIAGSHPDLKAKGKFRYVLSQPIHTPYWVWGTTSSMMFRRAALELILAEPEDYDKYRICADNYICHFANLVGNSLLIPEVHGYYRRHGQNNFSSNEMVGGAHPTGDMESHPKDYMVRLNIFDILCRRHDLFRKVLGQCRLVTLIAYTIGPYEVLKYKEKLPEKISKFGLFVLSFACRVKLYIGSRLAFIRFKAQGTNFSEQDNILTIPGR